MKKIATAVLTALALGLTAGAAEAKHVPGCNTNACDERVIIKQVHSDWRAEVARYDQGTIRARAFCESGGHGLYKLRTTGNGFWFAFQFNIAAWVGSGGRFRDGEPVGWKSKQPTALEQKVRMIRWERIHGGDAWPNCP